MPVLLAIAIFVILLLIIIAGRPDEFEVTRETKISAPSETVFAQVNDFHKWDAWSPWAKLDPECKNTFDGAPVGEGAIFAWDGNKKVGAGRMTITESQPNNLIRINLEFLRPFKTANATEFIFQPEGNQTTVTWSMFGKQNFMCKAFGLFMDGDKMIGGDFEKGLAGMKTIAEAAAKSRAMAA